VIRIAISRAALDALAVTLPLGSAGQGKSLSAVLGGPCLIAALALVGCAPPDWRDPATSKGSAAVAPEVLMGIARAEAERKPVALANLTTLDPLPAPPAWAAGLMAQPMDHAFHDVGSCIGNTDGVEVGYVGTARGVRIAGWGWDPVRKSPIGRVVLMGPDGLIAGAGEGGTRRLDVLGARPEITSETTGWKAVTPRFAGLLYAYGVLADGKSICRLGYIEL